VDLTTAKDAELRDVLKRHNAAPADVAQLNGPKLVDEVFKTCVEPKLVQPTVRVRLPTRVVGRSAKPKRGDPNKVERWELFVQHRELANAFSELNDPDEQRRRFEQQTACAPRRQGGAALDRTFSVRWNTACRPPAAWGWAWTGCDDSCRSDPHSRRDSFPHAAA